MKYVREWHNLIMPKYEFKYFLERTQKLGTQKATKVFF